MINILLDAQSNYKFVNNIRTLFEITLLKMLNITSTSNDIPVKPNNEDKQNKEIKQTYEEPKQINVASNNSKNEGINSQVLQDTNILNQLANDGEKNHINQEDLIKIMVTGNKEMKKALIDKWKNLEMYKLHPQLGKFAALLLNGKPYVMNEKILILDYQFANEAQKANLVANQNSLSSMVELISGIKTKIYALSRNESYDASRTFMELRQLSKLPDIKVEDIEINIKGE